MWLRFATLCEKHITGYVNQHILWQEHRKLTLTNTTKVPRLQLINTYGCTGQVLWIARKKHEIETNLDWFMENWTIHLPTGRQSSTYSFKQNPYRTDWQVGTLSPSVTWNWTGNTTKTTRGTRIGTSTPPVQENLHLIWLRTSKSQRLMLFLLTILPTCPPLHRLLFLTWAFYRPSVSLAATGVLKYRAHLISRTSSLTLSNCYICSFTALVV